MRERFPRLGQLIIEMMFSDTQRLGIYSPQLRTLGASAKAFFAFACPRTLCLDGGFDLDPIVQGAFEKDRAGSSGTLQCRGWLHPSRSDDTRCRLELRYALHLLHEIPQATDSKPTHTRLRLHTTRSSP